MEFVSTIIFDCGNLHNFAHFQGVWWATVSGTRMATRQGSRPRESALEERVRKRILALKDRGDVDQKTLSNGTRISPSKLSKILSGKQRMTLAYLEEFCFFFQLTPAELVSDPHVPFTQLKEMEPDILLRVREMEDKERRALIDVLDWRLKKVAPRGRQRIVGSYDGVLSEQAIAVARQFQKASELAQQQVRRTLALEQPSSTTAPDAHRLDAPHRAAVSHGPAQKSRIR